MLDLYCEMCNNKISANDDQYQFCNDCLDELLKQFKKRE